MINNYWYIRQKGKFEDTRGARIGASEVPTLLPNPEKPTESLTGYDNTAVTLYNEKVTGNREWKYNLSAEMGHFLENKALELFIRRFFGKELSKEFLKQKIMYELSDRTEPENYQVGLFRHNTEYYTDGMIVHPDLIYLGNPELLNAPKNERYITVEGVRVDKAKPFYVEAKSATRDSAKRRDTTTVKGYDFETTGWQGIPLKHYTQMQFQSALYEVPTGYLALIHDTSKFQVWEVQKDKKWQKNIIDLVGRFIKHIEDKNAPKEMAISLQDVISLYPTLKKDHLSVNGEISGKIKDICLECEKAKNQIKNWKSVEKDCKDALGVYLKDFDEIIDGADKLVKWRKSKGRVSIGVEDLPRGTTFIKWLEKNDINAYRYLERKGYIKVGKETRSVDVKYKG